LAAPAGAPVALTALAEAPVAHVPLAQAPFGNVEEVCIDAAGKH
jgi:hypothetical protein